MTFRELLARQGFTQVQLANKINVQQVTVSKWVCGKSIPTKDKMKKIAQALNINELIVIQSFYN